MTHERVSIWLTAVALGVLAGALIAVPVAVWLASMGEGTLAADARGTAVAIGYAIWVIVGAAVCAYLLRRASSG